MKDVLIFPIKYIFSVIIIEFKINLNHIYSDIIRLCY
jgi:hypothetical protein